MKILVIASSQKMIVAEKILCDSLLEMFTMQNISYTFDSTEKSVDCIVLLNKHQLTLATKLKKANKIPLLYFFQKSKITENYTLPNNEIDHIFIINDMDLKIFYPYSFNSNEINLIFNINAQCKENKYENIDIYVSTSEMMCRDSALLKIIRVLNRLTNYKIEINSSSKTLSKILNSNIIVSDSRDEIERRVANSKIVVGSGYAILYAIKHKKPFIVIGEKGYGGILNENNFAMQYKNFFQGRSGGKFDDAIPEKLLLEDIETLCSNPQDNTSIFQELLVIESQNSIDIIFEKIIELIECNNHLKSDFDNTYIIFNPDFTVKNGNGFYWLLNRFTREIIACISNDYFSVITKCIECPILVKEIGESSQIKKIIRELIINKALLSVSTKEKTYKLL